ncbi:MAG TPA: hypothetical protein VGW39_14340 [Chthoniobacterales bacterium]|nr:hypothetical protein [Chthoniobacterales bacterium]
MTDALNSDETASVAPPVGAGKWRWAARGGCFLAALTLLWPCWVRSSSRLGDLYDYSLFIASAQHILRGLRPYHDLQTPLQSLTFIYNAGWEALLGSSYASLAWGNFALALVLFVAVLLLLEGPLRLAGAFLIALCLTLASVLQHGVPSHNGLAFTILAVQSLLAARAAKDGRLGPGRVAALLVLATLGGMGKLNFHFVGTAAAALGVFLALRHPSRTQRAIWRALMLAGGYVLFSLLAGPLLELAWTGVSPRTWWFNVIETPVERREWLMHLLVPGFWFDIINDNYPRVHIRGIAFLGAILFTLGAIVCFAAAPGGWRPAAIVRRILPMVVTAYFFVTGCLLIVTNSETILLNSAYFVVGLVCLGLIYGERIGAWAKYYFQGAALSLALVMLVAAVVAIRHFSRINYGKENTAVRWTAARKIDPSAEQFFGKVSFSPRATSLLSEVFRVLDRYQLRDKPETIYWGPGIELMNQLNGHSQVPGLPVCWGRGVYARESDAPRIIEALRASPYQWIIMSKMWSVHLPVAVFTYLEAAYEVERNNENIIVYRRRPESASP